MQSMIEQKKMKDEARALEYKKREEAKAEQLVRAAEVCINLLNFFLMASLVHFSKNWWMCNVFSALF